MIKWWRGYRAVSKAPSVARTTSASVVLEREKLGTTSNLPSVGCLAKEGPWSGRKERSQESLVQSSTRPVQRSEDVPDGQPSPQHSVNQKVARHKPLSS